jgi:hypothetical protein
LFNSPLLPGCLRFTILSISGVGGQCRLITSPRRLDGGECRASRLDVDARVFPAGLADRNLRTNHAQLIDVGADWYLNQFVKVYFDWEHALFDTPVLSGTSHFRESSDLFWVRTQLYF